jgi:hypothetical protein
MKFSRKIQNLIANFRGLPPDNSFSFLKEERSVDEILRIIFKKNIKTSRAKVGGDIIDHWPQIVGDSLGQFCMPHTISPDGTLIVKVQNSVIRQELFMRTDEILERLQRLCVGSEVCKIVFSF